jgi:uroporphyrinogen-III synthase
MALADICKDYGSLLTPKVIRGSSATGTSERLAHFILEDLSAKESAKKLLYLTGDKNRDVLPNILKSGNVELESLQVYETQGSSNFANDLDEAIQTLPSGITLGPSAYFERIWLTSLDPERWWIIFFAPSAAEFVTPILRNVFDLPMLDAPTSQVPPIVRLAAIGPTTSAFLKDRLKMRVDVVAPKPTPVELAGAINAAEID